AKGDVMILIGPEGDFSPEEVKEAVAAGFVEISLGEQRLRTETAAVASTVIVATKGR
ncbi:MAG: RsmE family RNA methyltransferase, partial [Rikenellaceae bacterium]